jgi:hypothetical protein
MARAEWAIFQEGPNRGDAEVAEKNAETERVDFELRS